MCTAPVRYVDYANLSNSTQNPNKWRLTKNCVVKDVVQVADGLRSLRVL